MLLSQQDTNPFMNGCPLIIGRITVTWTLLSCWDLRHKHWPAPRSDWCNLPMWNRWLSTCAKSLNNLSKATPLLEDINNRCLAIDTPLLSHWTKTSYRQASQPKEEYKISGTSLVSLSITDKGESSDPEEMLVSIETRIRSLLHPAHS